MQVRLAENAGFCYGVERAVNACYEALKEGGRIYTYGPIVHNETVVEELTASGIKVISGMEELRALKAEGLLEGSTVILRAHGVGKDVTEELSGIRVIDPTCPFVKKIHRLVTEHHAAGERIIVTGSAVHPEVQGILGQIEGDALVIESPEEARAAEYDPSAPYFVVSQTTFNVQKFKDIVEFLKETIYDVYVADTICNATELRQREAYELSRECDMMIVIGGRNSSNTAKLYEICSGACSLTQYIGSLEDFDNTHLGSVRCIGITAGASTPKNIIQEVLKYVRDEL